MQVLSDADQYVTNASSGLRHNAKVGGQWQLNE